jgi:hypothetical protein
MFIFLVVFVLFEVNLSSYRIMLLLRSKPINRKERMERREEETGEI